MTLFHLGSSARGCLSSFRKLILLFCIPLLVFGLDSEAKQEKPKYDPEIQAQLAASWKHLRENLLVKGIREGAVIASPSWFYFFHWVRDAGKTQEAVLQMFLAASDVMPADEFQTLFKKWIDFETIIHNNRSETDLGEPKHHVDGRPFTEPWGRPQNDGPAIRASTATAFAWYLLGESGRFSRKSARGKAFNDHAKYVIEHLYGGGLFPAKGLIKEDLEYVSHHWKETSFDLWEEVRGMHVYTLMVQRRALVEGAKLARQLHDAKDSSLKNEIGASDYYLKQAGEITLRLNDFRDYQRGLIRPTFYKDHNRNKNSDLDIAVILGVLHGEIQDRSLVQNLTSLTDDLFTAKNAKLNGVKVESDHFTVVDDLVLGTAAKLRTQFAEIYPINKNSPGLFPMIGRYPEDTYTGTTTDGEANAWFIATHAYAELLFKASKKFQEKGFIDITPYNKLFFEQLGHQAEHAVSRSDKFRITKGSENFDLLINRMKQQGVDAMKRAISYSNKGRMSEQVDRYTAEMRGAEDLTWSYASSITATLACQKALGVNTKK